MDSNLRNICLKLKELNKEITNLRLQKLLYFIQVYCLIEYNEAAFDAKIEAWPYGPVVPEAYFAFKQDSLGADNINLDENRIKAVENINEIFENWEDFKIVNLTHSYSIWEKKINSIFSNKIMTTQEIRDFHLKKYEDTNNAI